MFGSDLVDVLVGRVVREAVSLDAGTRRLLAALRGEEQSMPSSVSGVLEACSGLLPDAGLSDEEFEAGTSAIAAASTAYQQRNRYVHDMLFPKADEGWLRARFDRGLATRDSMVPVSTGDLEQCHRDLSSAAWRIWGLQILIDVVRDPRRIESRHHLTTIASGQFAFDGDDSISW